MTAVWVVLYTLVGLVAAGFAAWDAAKDEAQRVDPHPMAPLGMGAVIGLIWPLALVLVILASAGTFLIEKAGGKS